MIKASGIIHMNKAANNRKGQLLLTIPFKSGFKQGDRVIIYPGRITIKKD